MISNKDADRLDAAFDIIGDLRPQILAALIKRTNKDEDQCDAMIAFVRLALCDVYDTSPKGQERVERDAAAKGKFRAART